MSALTHAAPAPASRVAGRGFFSRYLREVSVALAYGLLLLALYIFRPAFFHGQFATTGVSAAPILVMAVGMTLLIIAGQIDISIGSQFSACGIIAALLAAHHLPMPVVVLGTLAAGAAMGAINGVISVGLPSIVVTLAMLFVIRGTVMWSRQGEAVRLPQGFQWLGFSQRVGQALIVIVATLVFLAFAWGLRWLNAGRAIYAVGSDREAARLAGIRPRRVVISVFMLMGALSGLAALLNAVQFIVIYPDAGKDLELQVIAAVVIGGAAITGGRGTLIGTLIGVALLATIAPALIFFHLQSQWAKAIGGLIILLAVATDGLQRRRN